MRGVTFKYLGWAFGSYLTEIAVGTDPLYERQSVLSKAVTLVVVISVSLLVYPFTARLTASYIKPEAGLFSFGVLVLMTASPVATIVEPVMMFLLQRAGVNVVSDD